MVKLKRQEFEALTIDQRHRYLSEELSLTDQQIKWCEIAFTLLDFYGNRSVSLENFQKVLSLITLKSEEVSTEQNREVLYKIINYEKDREIGLFNLLHGVHDSTSLQGGVKVSKILSGIIVHIVQQKEIISEYRRKLMSGSSLNNDNLVQQIEKELFLSLGQIDEISGQNKKLTDTIDVLKKQNESLQNDHDILERKLKEAQHLLSKGHKPQEASPDSVDSNDSGSKRKIAWLEKQYDGLEKSYNESVQEVKEKEAQLKNIKLEFQNLQNGYTKDNLKEITSKNEADSFLIRDLENEVKKLKVKIHQKDIELQELEEDLEQMVCFEEYNSLKEEYDLIKKQLNKTEKSEQLSANAGVASIKGYAVEELRIEIQNLKEEKEEMKQNVSQLTSDIKEVKKTEEVLLNEKLQLSNELERRIVSEKQMIAEMNRVQKELEFSEKEHQSLSAKYEMLQESMDKKLSTLKEKYNAVKLDGRALKEKYEKLKTKYDERKDHLDRVRNENKELKSTTEGSKNVNEVSQLKIRIQDLGSENLKMKSQSDLDHREIMDLKEQLAQFKMESSLIKIHTSDAETDSATSSEREINEKLKRQLEELTADRSRLQNEILKAQQQEAELIHNQKSLEDNYRQTLGYKEDLEKKILNMKEKAEFESLVREKEDLANINENLKLENGALKASFDESKAIYIEIRDLKVQIRILEEKLEECNKEKDNVLQSLSQLRLDNLSLNKKLEESSVELDVQEKKILQLSQQKNEQMTNVEIKTVSLKEENAKLETNCKELLVKNSELNNKIQDLEQQSDEKYSSKDMHRALKHSNLHEEAVVSSFIDNLTSKYYKENLSEFVHRYIVMEEQQMNNKIAMEEELMIKRINFILRSQDNNYNSENYNKKEEINMYQNLDLSGVNNQKKRSQISNYENSNDMSSQEIYLVKNGDLNTSKFATQHLEVAAEKILPETELYENNGESLREELVTTIEPDVKTNTSNLKEEMIHVEQEKEILEEETQINSVIESINTE